MSSYDSEVEPYRKLVEKGVLIVESETKYENENRDVAALSFFAFSLALIPVLLVAYLLVLNPFSQALWFFSIFFITIDLWLFKYGWDFYKLHKDPLGFFWPYFKKKYVKLVLLGTVAKNGTEYVSHHFVTDDRYILRKRPFYIIIRIRKDIHEKAAELISKSSRKVVDKDGIEKVAFDENIIKNAEEDVILVSEFIKTLYLLYAKDIDKVYVGIKGEKP